MKNVIIFSNDVGGVSICVPTGELPIEHVKSKDCPTESHIVAIESLPESDYDFFNAWEQSDGVVSVNLKKAAEITKTRLRVERASLLADLDVAYMKALETGTDTSVIVAEKQRLRNITMLADGCSTTAELRALKAQ